MFNRLIPHPHLSIVLAFVWLGLVNTVSLGNVILAVVLAIVVPMQTAPYWPNRPILRSPIAMIKYTLMVLWDIVIANVQVAWMILTKPSDQFHSHWVTVPIELRAPEAITVLAGTITMTPGTVSAVLAADGHSILVHCLHTDDPEAEIDHIKRRYEAPLTEIFG